MKLKNEILERLKKWRESPFAFIEDIWGLIPQPLICSETGVEHIHGVRCYGEFIKGKHLTWQQVQIIEAVEKAIKGEDFKRISVASGHGTGKTSSLSLLIFWFLFTRKNAQIGCTAPSSAQMFDVLWKEAEIWRKRMPKDFADLFIWQSSYIRVAESPETWFARARTGRKEAPEAFSGLHSTHLFLIGDESSAIPDEIYRSAEGSLTNKDTLVILISNPTRLEGYFYATHHEDKNNWQRFQFSSIDSPIVEGGFSERIGAKFGRDSNEYKFMVLGQFPSSEGMIDGWLPMFDKKDINDQVADIGSFVRPAFMGVDPSGLGRNLTAWVGRDAFKMKVLALEKKSTTVGMAEKTITIAGHYEIKPENVKIDSFGAGSDISQEIALGVNERVHPVNVGGKPLSDRFLNIRAEMYWNFREWLKKGGKLVRNDCWNQLLTIFYKRTLSGKIQVMSKEEMMKRGWDSPNEADAGALTFVAANIGRESMSQILGIERSLSDEEMVKMTDIY